MELYITLVLVLKYSNCSFKSLCNINDLNIHNDILNHKPDKVTSTRTSPIVTSKIAILYLSLIIKLT